jgi:beta-N-acetylhexosaminidase
MSFPAGRLLMVDIEGQSLDAATARFLRERHIRAVCLFRKNLGSETQIRRLTADLRDAMGERALIAMDQEGGSVVRALTLPQAPSAMALGAAGDEALAAAVGAAVARGLRHLGINWNFAPVVDVNSNPANPVIAERSFGSDPHAVARLAGAWMRGAAAEGVACCLKHFPGHGDTQVDSHHSLPSIDKSLAALEALELVPFRALAAHAPSVMTAHIVYPQIDPGRPATLSPRLLGGLLREQIGYAGVVVTDALMMKAVHDRYGHARAAVLALLAGADMPLAQGSRAEQLAALRAMEQALAEGRLAPQAVARAASRLDALAERFPAREVPLSDARRAGDEQLMRSAWARGLAAVGAPQPPRRDEPLRVVTQARVGSDGISEAGLPAAAVRSLFDGFIDVEHVECENLAEVDPALLRCAHRKVVLAGNQRARYARAGGLCPDLHIPLWNPFQVLDVAAPAVLTWGYAEGARVALKAWLQGQAPALGVPPVALNPPPAATCPKR